MVSLQIKMYRVNSDSAFSMNSDSAFSMKRVNSVSTTTRKKLTYQG